MTEYHTSSAVDAAEGHDCYSAVMQSSLLIADEPTTALDVTVQPQILELMRTAAEAEYGGHLNYPRSWCGS